MTAHRRSLGLRTAPRPPAQRGVGAAGATMQEGDAHIFEPLINLETKKKNPKLSLAITLS